MENPFAKFSHPVDQPAETMPEVDPVEEIRQEIALDNVVSETTANVPLEQTPVDYAAIAAPLGVPHLPPCPNVPDWRHFDPRLAATLCTGQAALDAAHSILQSQPRPIAMDIETAGLGPKSFTVKCVTIAWDDTDGITAVLLDIRNDQHKECVQNLTQWATHLIFHNSPFDIPPLCQHGVIGVDEIEKVWDTVIAARMAWPDTLVPKTLEALATRDDVLALTDNDVTMSQAFSAAGFGTQHAGFEGMDIDVPVYRLGALADTVLTLRMAPKLVDAVVSWLTRNPFTAPTVPDSQRALELLEREQITNRVMLRTNARGLLVDTGYLDRFKTLHEQELHACIAPLHDAGLDHEAGNLGLKLVEHLDAIGELPESWPRTDKGALKVDKKAMKALADHPLVKAQQKVSELRKVSTYLDQIAGFASVTGRVHPQVGILGASKTGRMSASNPALQQFPGPARGILVPDEGTSWTSIDWSSIEPVVVANCAGDHDFLTGFNEHGADLYAPIVEQAGVERKTAKVVLLATMYGQGRKKLAETLGVDEDSAREIQDRVFSAMPNTRQFLDNLRRIGDSKRVVMTADGRLLPIPVDRMGHVSGYKATNYFTQGSAYSVLSESLNAVHKAGLSDAIRLAMHDELVVDSEAARDIQHIMSTPPEWLETFAQTRVVLRTDANQLQNRWHYV